MIMTIFLYRLYYKPMSAQPISKKTMMVSKY